ncbi:Pseudouridine synthase [Trema orientale]|uniref:Pseudouridine synthase n=1 Tax=Trema orientale TaxID=63057 RepID=A0A2P5ENI9_TREOI|nr:Pseudouridine synthase [Trema orientale]
MWHNAIASSWWCIPVLKPYWLCNYTTGTTITRSPKPQMALKTLDESDVGIFCYISHLPGFRGVLKQRYSDFIVKEVDTDGNVVHLTSLDAPPEEVKTAEVNRSETNEVGSKSYTSEIESFRCLAGDCDAERFEAFINQINSGAGEESITPIVLSPDSDKSHRTAMHNFFKKNFKFLVTDTIDGPDASSKCIRVRLNSGAQNNQVKNSKKRKGRGDKPFDSRGSDDWPEHIGKFLRFHLYKENKDSQEALGLIAKMLGIQPRSFGFAGTKDKRSVSTQRVTVFKQRASRLAALNDRLIGTDHVVVGDLVYCKEHDAEEEKEIANAECEDEETNDVLDSHDLDEISGTDLSEERKNLVKAVTADDILSGNYTIDDVVLPLPGSRVILPTNDIAQVYHDLAKKDAISLTESAHNVKEFSITSMTGSYRRVLQKPIDYEWELLTYTDGTVPLAETDLDIIAKSKPAKLAEEDPVNENKERNGSNSTENLERSENDLELQTDNNEVDGEREVRLQVESNSQEAQMALKLRFTLPSSCYATMAIRELLKTSTSGLPQNVKLLGSGSGVSWHSRTGRMGHLWANVQFLSAANTPKEVLQTLNCILQREKWFNCICIPYLQIPPLSVKLIFHCTLTFFVSIKFPFNLFLFPRLALSHEVRTNSHCESFEWK